MQVTLVTSNTKLVATSVWARPANVGPTYQCLPRPVTGELLCHPLSSVINTTALGWPWP